MLAGSPPRPLLLFLALFAFTLLSSRQKAAQARSKAGVMARSWQPAVCSQVQTSASGMENEYL